ncbi:BnaC06g27590D [Brassica napus]|uniref:BnaC06g27590D protein n=1 Tax=Brassica napus TaxID=3708 RepID=A0A078HCS7_BRANA|nr:BnaC06g27590D [Brassica napus]
MISGAGDFSRRPTQFKVITNSIICKMWTTMALSPSSARN